MKKNDMLPVIAAFVIALLVVPIAAVPVNALTPSAYPGIASVVTIPEDDLKRNTGVMVLGIDPADYLTDLTTADGWYTDSSCATGVGTLTVGPEITDEPVLEGSDFTYVTAFEKVSYQLCVEHTFLADWPKDWMEGLDLLSQHKILATLNGVPTDPDYVLCEIVEKEKAKVPPMDTKTPSKRQFPDEIIKTTLQDVTDNFICKVNWIKPGVGALDVYFVGPRVMNFIADHMLIVTVGYTVGRTTIWASELQDICILGWSMGMQEIAIELFWNPGLSTFPGGYEIYYSWDDAINTFVSCDEAALWQLAWLNGGWPWAEN